ncbi:hypothetical protein GmHk_U059625 [Glycine max]|nr:hypothetical protein GmHk_U059625 [Glycine max]
MNNMVTLQHIEIKASFETSTHVVGHVFKVTLYKKLLGMVSRYALNQIASEFELVNYVGIDSSHCGCIMRTTRGLLYSCELARYVLDSIPLDTIHMFWWRLSFSEQCLFEPEVNIIEEMEAISKQFEELDVYGKVTLKSKLLEISYPDLNFVCAPPEKTSKQQRSTNHDPSYWEYVDALYSLQFSNSSVKRVASSSEQPKPKRKMFMLDQFHPCIHDFIENIVDVKPNGNYGYRTIAALLELGQWSNEYMHLVGGIDRYEELKRSLHVDELSMVYKFYVTYS